MSKSHIEICEGVSSAKNTGFKDNCLESKLLIPVLSNGFMFEDVDDFKNKASWKAAIQSKSLVPLFPVYELADASTEDTKFESGNFSKVTSKGVEKITFEFYLSIAAYAAAKSFERAGTYGELFEFNQDGDYSGVFAADGVQVKGRKITSFKVTRIRATKDKVPYVKGEITFAEKDDVLNAVIVHSDLSESDLTGIFDVTLEQVSMTSTSIKLKAHSGGLSGSLIDSFNSADFLVKDASGEVQTVSVVAPGNDGIYEFTGTGFVAGFTVELNGVVAETINMYETPEPLVLS